MAKPQQKFEADLALKKSQIAHHYVFMTGLNR